MSKKPIEYVSGKLPRMYVDLNSAKKGLDGLQSALERLAKDNTMDGDTESFVRSQLIDKISEQKELIKQITGAIYLAEAKV